MSVAPPNTQAIRSVNINSSSSTPPNPNEVFYVGIYPDPITKNEIILWEDIRVAFHNALYIRHKTRILHFMRDAEFNALWPIRIAVIPGEVLDVFLNNLQDSTPQHQQPSVLRRIEQQAARLPNHDPFSTMRPISSTHLSSRQYARFARPGNYFSPTVSNSLDDLTFRAHNKELAKQYARDAMSKVAAKMDLDALYKEGDGPPGDFWKALECYLKAVRKSHAHAQVSVGDLFSEGQGVTKDTPVAMGWYLKAAFQGDTNAQRKAEALRRSQLRQTAAPNAPIDNTPDNQRRSSNPTDVQPPNRNNESRISNNPSPTATESLEHILLNTNLGDQDAQVAVGDMCKEGNNPPSPVPQSATAPHTPGEQKNLFQTTISAFRRVKDAQVALGDMYRKGGEEVPQDFQEAMYWYLKAAEQGDPVGQQRVGVMYELGLGVPQDYSIAMNWFLKAANQGNTSAQSKIGSFCILGQGVPRDYEQAIFWYLKVANQGDALAQFTVGSLYDDGRGVPRDYEQAMFWYLKAANQGDASAQFNVGSLYGGGRGVPQDYKQAMFWYLKAANQGDASAQFNVGSLYGGGRGVPQDCKQAMFWYLKAANQGHAQSQYNAGLLYLHGRCVPRDEAQAAELFLMAANQGYASAQFTVGFLYDNGRGVPRDYGQAMFWYLKAANQGDVQSQNNVGLLYFHGRGVPQDEAQAAEMFLKAAKQGLADSQYWIGHCYIKGLSVPEDLAKGIKWYQRAADQGHAFAKTALEGMKYYSQFYA
ncbi:hypothetical protein BGZ88_007655 [Linnemannia elongata]|nr:hypothetical protein BGZ88_007655 [Linnemannia elongata]